MKHTLTTLFIGLALTLTACGKDKKPTTTDPAKTEPTAAEPAKTDPAAPADPAKADPKADDKPKAGGW